ncbi:hypothetical protein V8C35DRAFT_309854 [Trichoderma chlorosporum]
MFQLLINTFISSFLLITVLHLSSYAEPSGCLMLTQRQTTTLPQLFPGTSLFIVPSSETPPCRFSLCAACNDAINSSSRDYGLALPTEEKMKKKYGASSSTPEWPAGRGGGR